jgi:hypothetical protein
MANHYQHPVVTRRDCAVERLLELLTRIVELWVEFWAATEPGVHATGATDRWGDTLHDIDITAVHDGLAPDTGRYAQLLAAQVISGDPELTDITGWTLAGNLYDPTGGAA